MTWFVRVTKEPDELLAARERLAAKEGEVLDKLYPNGSLGGYEEMADRYARRNNKDN